MSVKKIGLYLPVKDPHLTNSLTTGILPKMVLNELYHLLDANTEITYFKDLDIRQAIIENDKVYIGEICLSELDLFFWYYPLTARDSHSFEMQVLQILALRTKVLPNPIGLANGLDKFTSHSILRQTEIATPEFTLFESTDTQRAKDVFDQWQTLVLKPTLGCFGQGVVKIDNKQTLLDTIAYAESFNSEPLQVFLEKFETNSLDKWISTTVIGNKVIYGYRKQAEKFTDGWKVYDEQQKGGSAFYVDPAPVSKIALKAKQALGADIIGFDFIFSERQQTYLIVDENTFPGMYKECFAQAKQGTWAENFYNLIMQTLEKTSNSQI